MDALALSDFPAYLAKKKASLPAGDIRARMAGFTWNRATEQYEVTIGLYSTEVVKTFTTLKPTRDFVTAHNAALVG